MMENGRDSASSTPRSPEKTERPPTPSRNRDHRDPFVDEKKIRHSCRSPRPGTSLTPIVRPTARRPQQSILGENTPPAVGYHAVALQNMSTSTPQPKEPELPPG